MSNTDRVSLARRKAILIRHRPADDAELMDVARAHAVLALEESIVEIVSKAPPLRPDQIERLRGLLAPRFAPKLTLNSAA